MDYEKLCIYCMREKKNKDDICPYCGGSMANYKKDDYELSPFTILNGRYLLGRVIGAGGFGITYIALDLVLERRVAVKEFFMGEAMYRTKACAVTVSTINEAQDEMYRNSKEKFEREAKILAHLNNMPGIVQVHDFFQENGTAYIAMEYLGGKTLGEYVKEKGGRLSLEETKKILFPIMESLDEIHMEGILHRDISPDNIKFSEDGALKLFDFGGAKLEKKDGVSKVVYMKAGYSPLEQYTINGNQGPWTDVYAMAATMYFCICGKRPPEAPDRSSGEQLILPEKYGIKISKKEEKVLVKALELRYDLRYQTMEEFKEELEKSAGNPKWQKIVIAVGAIGIGLGILAFAALVERRSSGKKQEVAVIETESEKITEKTEKAETEKAAKEATETETQKATEKITEAETQKATEKATEKITEAETQKATEKATEKITEAETQKATEKITELETRKATEKMTEKAAEKVTEKATEKVAEPETEKITEKATESETEKKEITSSKGYAIIKCEDDEHYTFLKEEPDKYSTTLLNLRKHNIVNVGEIKTVDGEKWGYADYFGCYGWVRMRFLKKVEKVVNESYEPGDYFIWAGGTNVREKPNAKADSLGKLDYGAGVKVKSIENGWAKVTYKGKTGYIYGSCLSKYTAGIYVVNTVTDYGMHVRDIPSKEDSKKIMDISNGTGVYISEFSNGWGKVTYDGKQGWVQMSYLYLLRKDS